METLKGMRLVDFRERKGISLDAMAAELGFKSKGFLSRLENGERPSLELALRIQVWSRGEVTAAELRPDLADLIAAALAAAPPASGGRWRHEPPIPFCGRDRRVCRTD